jgi:hypothetical protein
MIGAWACQKGGSMSSKSTAERAIGDKKGVTGMAGATGAQPGTLTLVRGLEPQPAGRLKPGIY